MLTAVEREFKEMDVGLSGLWVFGYGGFEVLNIELSCGDGDFEAKSLLDFVGKS